jgi:kynurenine formamidase
MKDYVNLNTLMDCIKGVNTGFLLLVLLLFSCSSTSNTEITIPNEIIELGALVTEDLPENVWGKAILRDGGYTKSNSFEIINWPLGSEGDQGPNSYYTLFNHGGPHVDAPNHIGLVGGIDSYSVDSFVGKLKVFDVSDFPNGRTIPIDFFKEKIIEPGDIVIIYTDYSPPVTDDDYPETITLTPEATEYLCKIPVRAFGTDSWSTGNVQADPVLGNDEISSMAPVHHAFLSRGIPIYEQLFNVEKLLNKQNMYFVGVPLNIKDGDGMMVRPVVLIY